MPNASGLEVRVFQLRTKYLTTFCSLAQQVSSSTVITKFGISNGGGSTSREGFHRRLDHGCTRTFDTKVTTRQTTRTSQRSGEAASFNLESHSYSLFESSNATLFTTVSEALPTWDWTRFSDMASSDLLHRLCTTISGFLAACSRAIDFFLVSTSGCRRSFLWIASPDSRFTRRLSERGCTVSMRILCVIRWNTSRPTQFVESELLCLGEVCSRDCTMCAHPVVSKMVSACRCEMCTEGQFGKRFRMQKSTSVCVSVTVSTDKRSFSTQ